jgi:hypothetical protein
MPRLRPGQSAHAVDQAEVDDLGIAALLAAHLLRRHAEHLGRRGAVHVQPVGEGAQQRLVAAEVRHDAQLDLAVVGAGNHAARRRHEGLAHAPALGVRIGMFCRLGSLLDRRPVTATACA